MKLVLTNREQLGALGAFLVNEFDSLISRIRGSWNTEHNEDDTHGNVHADTIATGRLTFSEILMDTITAGTQLDNYSPTGLDTAAILRINTALTTVDITGIKVPQDAAGNVLDGRVLVIENVSVNTPYRIFNEHTGSAVRNRISLPWAPAGAETQLQWYHLMPGTVTFLIYNATKTRWILHGQTNDAIRMTSTFSTSQHNYNPSGFRSSKYISLGATASGLSISGFDGRPTAGLGVAEGTTNIPYPSVKTITNDGLYEFDILHMNTNSDAANRVACPGNIRYRLHPRESVELYRSNSDTWKIKEKADQWIDVVYDSANFTAQAGAWTVDSGDVETYCYQIDGNMMTVSFSIITSSVTAAPVYLALKVPAGKTVARTMRNPLAVIVDAGVNVNTGFMRVVAGGTIIECYKDVAGTAWTLTAGNNTLVSGQITFMIRDDCATISEAHTDVAHGDAAHSDVEHSDIAHSDVTHGDSHSDASHSDIAHGDVAHSDVSHSDTPHTDVAHSDSAGCNTHGDVTHSDSPESHTDVAHQDLTHVDTGVFIHDDVAHEDSTISHSDIAHDDSHCDSPHSDSSHSDVTHVDVSHSDVAHSDNAHTDGGHADSHTDTVPHSDIAHVDVSHGDTAHSDSAHADVGYHCDTAHSDI